MKSEEAENCLKSGAADKFFLRRRNLQQNFRISIQHLIFLVTFFIKKKSDKRDVQSSKFWQILKINLKDTM
jgi:hypothetical protein